MLKERKGVRCATDNLIFKDTSEAAKYYNTTAKHIYDACKNFDRTSGKRFHWDLGEEFAEKFDSYFKGKDEREKEGKRLREELKRGKR